MNGRRDERGVALVLTLLILTALSAAAIGLMSSSNRQMMAVGREATKQCSIFAGDTGLTTAQTWSRSQGYIGPPPRSNEVNITSPTDPGYWNTRNFGGVGDADSATVADWRNMAPDLTLNDGTSLPADVWFQVSRDPTGVVYSNRLRGEEAGRAVRYDFHVRTTARCPNQSIMQLEQELTQTYTLPFYG